MVIISKLSFWIAKPQKQTKNSIIVQAILPSKKTQPFNQIIMDAFTQFTRDGYVEKLKTRITPDTLPSNDKDLFAFLYNQITNA